MSYRVITDVLRRSQLLDVRERMLARHLVYAPQRTVYARSGFTLEEAPWLFELLSPLIEIADREYGCPMKFIPEWSSCQLMRPGSGLAFPPHQDIAALGITDESQKGGVFWIPLDDITYNMPTLAVLEAECSLLLHEDDGRGLSVIKKDVFADVIQDMNKYRVLTPRIGDAVFLDARTVHMTHVPPTTNVARLSLDVRVKPA